MIDGGQSRYVSMGRIEMWEVSLSAKILRISMMAQLYKENEYYFC